MAKTIDFAPQGGATGKVCLQVPNLDAVDFDFSRSTVATVRQQDGTLDTAWGLNLPRYNFDVGDSCPALLLEPQSTNLYLNSETLVTQNITTSATTYTVSFYGTGTITFSGTYAGSLVGTGVDDRVSLTFTATAGTLTSTVTGSVTKGQVEALMYATSYIPTLGTSVTRTRDQLSKTGITSYLNPNEGVLFIEMAALFNDSTSRRITIFGDVINRIILLFSSVANSIEATIIGGGVATSLNHVTSDTTNFNKIALRYSITEISLFVNGVKVATTPPTALPSFLNDIYFGSGSNFLLAKIKEFSYYNTTLSDAELINLTNL